MSKITTKNLYSLVLDEIEKRTTYQTKAGYGSQLSHNEIAPFSMTGSMTVDTSISNIVKAVFGILEEALPGTILSGLEVSATDPISDSVTVSAGRGTKGGVVYELLSDTNITIPFDNSTTVYYLSLYKDRLMIDKLEDDKKLKIAKIIVPQPGVTNRVKDNKKDDFPWDAYIVNFTEYKLYGHNGNFEEDSVELLRDNIGDILADNLIGNIRLSENLKILNTAGTMELDSTSMKLMSATGTTLAKFNRNGVFFYNDSGVEMAKFSTDEARIGNIKITSISIESGNFLTGVRGFQITDNGRAEFDDVRVRGVLKTTVFEKDTISSVGGSVYIAKSDVLNVDMTSLDSSTLTIEGNDSFSIGDILRIKDGIDDEWLEVTGISGNTYTVTRDKKSSYASNNNPSWSKGVIVVDYGLANTGLIYMTASENNGPYFSIITHSGSPWSSTNERLRIGNLNGFLDYSSITYGIAIGEITKYLKYDPDNGLRIRGNLTMDSGYIGGENGWSITANEIVGSNTSRIRGGQTDYNTGTGFFLGAHEGIPKFSIGNSTTDYLTWDGDSLNISGNVEIADGSITADKLVDSVVGDLAIGALYARRMLTPNIKHSEVQTLSILNLGTEDYDSGVLSSLVKADGVLQVPTSDSWDGSNLYWDESNNNWDYTTEIGTWNYISNVKDLGASFYNLPTIKCRRTVSIPNTIIVFFRYSTNNVNWSDWIDSFPSLDDNHTIYYSEEIIEARYIQYKIVFTNTETTSSILSELTLNILSVMVELVYPGLTITNAATGYKINNLGTYFSKEYSVLTTVHGATMLNAQIITKDSPPNTLIIKLLNTSSTAVTGTFDLYLKGY